MKMMKRYSGVSVGVLGIGILACSYAVAENGYSPGMRGVPGAS